MVMRAVICKDDPTSHGGKVLEGNEFATTDGRPIAQKGHMTYCPQCKGNFPIAEGLDFHTYVGLGTAVEGMKTACGAILVATTTKDSFLIDVGLESDSGEATGGEAQSPHTSSFQSQSQARSNSQSQPESPSYSGSFRAVDETTGKPVAGMPYRIVLPDGTTLRGVTEDGYTERVTSHEPATVQLYWETDSSNMQSDAAGDEDEL